MSGVRGNMSGGLMSVGGSAATPKIEKQNPQKHNETMLPELLLLEYVSNETANGVERFKLDL